MTEFKEEINSIDDQERQVSPGERLRLAREQAGLTVKEVASHLKLSADKINSLEQGEVDQLAAPVFVAGYLRAYAKLVDLPDEEIIAEFKALSEMEVPSADPSTSPAANNYGQMETTPAGKAVSKKGKDWSQLAILGSLAIVLAAVIFFVFSGNFA